MRHDNEFQKPQPAGGGLTGLYQEVTRLGGEFQGDKGFENGASQSGREPDNLFLNLEGEQFADLSSISGLGTRNDGRSMAIWDFDRDGWQDMAIANANRPLLQIMRNQLAEISQTPQSHNMVAIRLVGGNESPLPSTRYSARDAVGARITLTVSNRKLVRELRYGEGLASQNSRTLIFGLGSATHIEHLKVHWPSGRITAARDQSPNQLIVIYEKTAASPNQTAIVNQQYFKNAYADRQPNHYPTEVYVESEFPLKELIEKHKQLTLFTTMATWCPTCLGELPQFKKLTSLLSPQDLSIVAVPIDPDDSVVKLERYLKRHQPEYRLAIDLPNPRRSEFANWVKQELKVEALPSSVIVDQNGRVVRLQKGLPTLSRVRELISASSEIEKHRTR